MTESFPGPERISVSEPGRLFREHVDRLVAEGGDMAPDEFTARMSRLLADRLGEHDVIPMGFVMDTTLLNIDCEKGYSGYTHEPMPGEVRGYPHFNYLMFEMMSADIARGAFGDAFADEVETIYGHMNASVQEGIQTNGE
jgi:hypothetical protein